MTSSLLARLWSHACDALNRLRATLMPLDVLLAQERRALRARLRTLEVFCRRLALTEALNMKAELLGRSSSAKARTSAGLTRLRRSEASASPRREARGPSRKRPPRLRLWPRAKPMPVRVTLLGPPAFVREIWREQHRAALIARLKRARLNRKPQHIRLADRLDALERFLNAPRAGIRRLARKLRLNRKLALQIALCKCPPSPHFEAERIRECDDLMWPLVLNSS